MPDALVVDRHKRYGDTAVWWLTRADAGQPSAASQPV